MTRLFENETTNTSSSVYVSKTAFATLFVWGTFGGATVSLEASPDGTEWFAESDQDFTSKSVRNLQLTPGVQYRATIDGGSSADLNVTII